MPWNAYFFKSFQNLRKKNCDTISKPAKKQIRKSAKNYYKPAKICKKNRRASRATRQLLNRFEDFSYFDTATSHYAPVMNYLVENIRIKVPV